MGLVLRLLGVWGLGDGPPPVFAAGASVSLPHMDLSARFGAFGM